MSQLLQPLLRQVGLPPLGDPSGALARAEVSGVSCDSRRIGPGILFVGLPGTAVDGGSFWPQALEAGAVAAVIGPEAAAARPPAPAIRCWWWSRPWPAGPVCWRLNSGATPAGAWR